MAFIRDENGVTDASASLEAQGGVSNVVDTDRGSVNVVGKGDGAERGRWRSGRRERQVGRGIVGQ